MLYKDELISSPVEGADGWGGLPVDSGTDCGEDEASYPEDDAAHQEPGEAEHPQGGVQLYTHKEGDGF